MSEQCKIRFLAILLSQISFFAFGQDCDLILHLIDGNNVRCTLLFVTDSSLGIVTNDIGRNNLTISKVNDTVLIRSQDIIQVTIVGKSKILQGMVEGILIGGVFGVLLGFAGGDDTEGFIRYTAAERASAFGVALGGSGLIIGAIAGIASSSGDQIIEPLPDHDFSILKPLIQSQKK